MKKTISLMKKVGQKAAEVPTEVRSWPGFFHQPKMPAILSERMKKMDKQ